MLLEREALKFKCTLLWCKIVVSWVSLHPFFSPGAPTSDANTLEKVDAKLTEVHKEEHKEPEWAVTPADREEKPKVWTTQWWSALFAHPRWMHSCRLPECSIKWSVPADEWTRCEEDEPEDGQAKVHPTCCVHTEPGHAAHHVGKQRSCMNYIMSNREGKNIYSKITVGVRILLVWLGSRHCCILMLYYSSTCNTVQDGELNTQLLLHYYNSFLEWRHG